MNHVSNLGKMSEHYDRQTIKCNLCVSSAEVKLLI